MFKVGFSYLDFERTGETAHLWVVIAEPASDPNERVIVSVTSDGPHIADRTCQLLPGDHGFIVCESYALYRKAAIVTVDALRGLIARQHLKSKAPASDDLVERLRVGAEESRFTRRDVKAAIRDCWWTPAISGGKSS